MDPRLEQKIRERAYEIWEQEGRPHGRDREHWFRAQSELTGGETIADAAQIATPTSSPRRNGTSAASRPVRVRRTGGWG